MASNDPVGTVQRMFTAFRGGDLDAVLDTIDADARWTYVGANPKPTKAELVGKAGARRFFEAILRRLEVTTFEANEFVLEGNTVVVFGEEIWNGENHRRAVPQRMVSEVHGQREPDNTHRRV